MHKTPVGIGGHLFSFLFSLWTALAITNSVTTAANLNLQIRFALQPYSQQLAPSDLQHQILKRLKPGPSSTASNCWTASCFTVCVLSAGSGITCQLR
eukprot:3721270-Amphidinium_carterae.1